MVRCFREDALINVSYAIEYDYEQTGSGWPSNLHYHHHNSQQSYNEFDLPLNIFDNLTQFLINSSNITMPRHRPANSNVDQRLAYVNAPLNYYFGPKRVYNYLLTKLNCTNNEFKYTFTNKELAYADRNLVFVVHVYDFQTPISIQIAFSRKSKVHLLHFFITFFGCLLTLLTIAGVTWKTKQRYDRYRRQREVLQQMEHMASRPFTKLFIDVSRSSKRGDTDESQIYMDGPVHSVSKSVAKKLSKKVGRLERGGSGAHHQQTGGLLVVPRIMPVAVEPLSNNKTAILTCLLKLPQGNANSTPKGSSPFVLCSAYVTVSPSLVNYQTAGGVNWLCDDEEAGSDNNGSGQVNVKSVQS
jgi:hypothetical protein